MLASAFVLAVTFIFVDCKQQILLTFPGYQQPCSTPCSVPASFAPALAPTPCAPALAPTPCASAPYAPPPCVPTPVPVCEAPRCPIPIPFIADLPSCPDLCFMDILTSPIGSLDPIFPIYGCPDIKYPAALASSLAISSPFPHGTPPGFTEDCCCDVFSRRVAIPPPFI